MSMKDPGYFDDAYCQEVSAAYWAEEDEFKAGIHPTQVKERIKEELHNIGRKYKFISFLDWNIEGPRVKVFIVDSYFGVFNYETNKFELISLKPMLN